MSGIQSVEIDRISNLPSDLIRSILDLLPLEDALRTSILSKQWRHKWATLSQLVLDEQFIDPIRRRFSGDNDQFSYAYAIVVQRILSHIYGPIHRVVLCVPLLTIEFQEILNLWLGFLSCIGMKEITLGFEDFAFENLCDFPCRLFSCVNLTHLSLHGCAFELPSTFERFPSLVSLELLYPHHTFVVSSSVKLISNCPQLENLLLRRFHTLEPFCVNVPKLRYLNLQGTGACFRFHGAVNLRALTLDFLFRDDEGFVTDVAHYLEEFFNPLSNIEELHIRKVFWNVSGFYEACGHEMPKFDMQCCFQCLQTVKIRCIFCSEIELQLIEYLLAWTPVLELISVELDVETVNLFQLRIPREQLMSFYRVSSKAEIICVP